MRDRIEYRAVFGALSGQWSQSGRCFRRPGALFAGLSRQGASCSLVALVVFLSGCSGGEGETAATPETGLQVAGSAENPPAAAAPDADAAPQAPTDPAANAESDAAPSEEQASDDAEESMEETEESPPAEPVTPEEPEPRERPDDFAQWSRQDFLDERAEARAVGRLLQAVKYLAENKQGDEETAALLVELSEFQEPQFGPMPEGDEDDRAVRNEQRRRESVFRAARSAHAQLALPVLAALGAVGTDIAFSALSEIVDGTRDIGLEPNRVLNEALAALVSIPGDKLDSWLLLAVTNPEQVRTVDDGSVSPEELRTRVLRLLPDLASARLRGDLAKHLASGQVSEEVQRALVTMLLADAPVNLRAQLVLYLGDSTEEDVRDQVEAIFAKHSVQALDELLGIPADAVPSPASTGRSTGGFGGRRPRPRATGSAAVDPGEQIDLAQEVVNTLWTAPFIAKLGERMGAVREIPDALDKANLVTTLPLDIVRSTISTYLQDNWESVESNNRAQFNDTLAAAVRDPGLIVVFKELPRRRDPEVRKARREGESSTSARPTAPLRGAAANDDPRQQQDQARYTWMDFSEVLVQSFNKRFYAAAQQARRGDAASEDDVARGTGASAETATALTGGTNGGAVASGGADSETSDAEVSSPSAESIALPEDFGLPLELHEGARVVAFHRVKWPDDVEERLSDARPSPLELHYVRIEGDGMVTKLATHYQRQLERPLIRFLENEGRWVDFVRESDDGQRQSIDVMLAPVPDEEGEEELTEAERRRRANQPRPLVIEILTLTVADPTS